jgi:natural product precursor
MDKSDLKLTNLKHLEIDEEELKTIFGGGSCTCGCYCGTVKTGATAGQLFGYFYDGGGQ